MCFSSIFLVFFIINFQYKEKKKQEKGRRFEATKELTKLNNITWNRVNSNSNSKRSEIKAIIASLCTFLGNATSYAYPYAYHRNRESNDDENIERTIRS